MTTLASMIMAFLRREATVSLGCAPTALNRQAGREGRGGRLAARQEGVQSTDAPQDVGMLPPSRTLVPTPPASAVTPHVVVLLLL